MINWCMRLYTRVIKKRSDDVTKTKFVKSEYLYLPANLL